MECVIGLTPDEARLRLVGLGFDVLIKEYESRNGVLDADSTRVIRQKAVGDNKVELVVSRFKTRIKEQECL